MDKSSFRFNASPYGSGEYIAEVARDKLGLVKGNEIVFEEEK